MVSKNKYLDKFKTDKKKKQKYTVEMMYSNNEKLNEIELLLDVYELNLYDCIELLIELKSKKKFYSSIIGRLFFNGSYHLIDIDYALKILKNSPMQNYIIEILN